jgi:hypothetical protein
VQDLNDKITGDTLSASEWDEVPSELQTVIETAGIVLSGGDLQQVAKGVSCYAGGGDFYNDSGSVNALVLGTPNLLKTPPALFKGLRCRTKVAVTNTGATTLNLAGLGSKKVLLDGALTPMTAGLLVAGYEYSFTYDPSLDGGAGAWTIKIQLTGTGETSGGADWTYMTPITLSGTSQAFTGIPTSVSSIVLSIIGMNSSGGGTIYHYLRTGYGSTTYQTTGYEGKDVNTNWSTSVELGSSVYIKYITARLEKMSGNIWSISTVQNGTTNENLSNGIVSMSGALTAVQVLTSGTAFIGGTAYLKYK